MFHVRSALLSDVVELATLVTQLNGDATTLGFDGVRIVATETTAEVVADVRPDAVAVRVLAPEAPMTETYVKVADGDAPASKERLDGANVPPAPPSESETAFVLASPPETKDTV